MAKRIVSSAQIELIKKCFLFAQTRGSIVELATAEEDSWIRYEYTDRDIRIVSNCFFYGPPNGFVTVRVEEGDNLVFDAMCRVSSLLVSCPGVFTHTPGSWEDKVTAC